jgi:hypothetical protein
MTERPLTPTLSPEGRGKERGDFEFQKLEIIWNLGFGYWDFPAKAGFGSGYAGLGSGLGSYNSTHFAVGIGWAWSYLAFLNQSTVS